MFHNYLKIALRVLVRQKSYALLNIIGLTFGLVGFIIIFLIVRDELSYDQSNKKIETLYVMGQDQFYGADTYHFFSMPPPLKALLEETIPEIVSATRFHSQRLALKPANESFDEFVSFADPDIFEMITFNIIEGNKNDPLEGLYSMSISQEIAHKLFKDENPIGKTISVRNEFEFTVTSVFEDLPFNLTYRPEIILPFEFMEKIGYDLKSWSNSFHIIINLDDKATMKKVSEKVKPLLKENRETTSELFLHPLKDMHLHNPRYKGGAIEYVYIFIIIGLSIILLACINFMNMATARSVKRVKEIGVRKAVGAVRKQVMMQFFGESILLSMISLNFAIVIVELFLPEVNLLTNKQLSIEYSNIALLVGFILIGLFTGLLAGAYPALYLSSFSPVIILRNLVKSNTGGTFRKVLVVFQFSISITLIICTTTVYNQLNFLMTADIGIDREQIVYFPLKNKVLQNIDALKTELQMLPMVDLISESTHLPNRVGTNGGGWEWKNKDPEYEVLISMTSSDEHYAKIYGMEIVKGRFFDGQLASDSLNRIVINEQFAELIDPEGIIGKTVFREGNSYEIIGVVKNFNINALRAEIPPLIMFYNAWGRQILSIRIRGEERVAMNAIEDIYKEMFPETPVNISLFEQNIENQYRREQRLGNVFLYFAILAVIISCLGLYGLSAFMAEQRKKEMGIRKTLGASTSLIVKMMLSNFAKWVILANIIAWPISWYITDQWLNKFAFHVSFSWWVFIIAGLSSLSIALITVLFQSVKTAIANPVYALKHE